MEQGHGVTYIDVKLFHGISNHIEICHHFIRQCIEQDEISIKHIIKKEQVQIF